MISAHNRAWVVVTSAARRRQPASSSQMMPQTSRSSGSRASRAPPSDSPAGYVYVLYTLKSTGGQELTEADVVNNPEFVLRMLRRQAAAQEHREQLAELRAEHRGVFTATRPGLPNSCLRAPRARARLAAPRSEPARAPSRDEAEGAASRPARQPPERMARGRRASVGGGRVRGGSGGRD